MTTKSKEIRENIEDAPHPDDVEGTEGYIAYTSRLLMEAGDESERVSNELNKIENSRSQISASIDITDVVEEEAPEVAEEIEELALSGAFYIRSCRFANASINGYPGESDDHK